MSFNPMSISIAQLGPGPIFSLGFCSGLLTSLSASGLLHTGASGDSKL